jgi:hypothetical protein
MPIDKGVRRLVDIGSPTRGVSLNELAQYAASAGDAWLRVYVDLDIPVANLPAMVREQLPNAVHVERTRPSAVAVAASTARPTSTAPEEMFAAFYRSSLGRSSEVSPGTMTLFRRLLSEEADATADA